MPQAPLADLEHRIHYAFDDGALLQLALTHRSHGSDNNERLELLGDAVLDLVITTILIERFPTAGEGQLSRFRARLVRAQTLARLARELDLGSFLIMGPGELRTGGFDRDSVLSDCFEALLGAVYLDGGLDPAARLVATLFDSRLVQLSLDVSQKDANTRLQEHLQSQGEPLPVYSVVNTTGRAHSQLFEVLCTCSGLEVPTVGRGPSRRIAEQVAAEFALAELGIDIEGVNG